MYNDRKLRELLFSIHRMTTHICNPDHDGAEEYKQEPMNITVQNET